jgi:hypothetical protein
MKKTKRLLTALLTVLMLSTVISIPTVSATETTESGVTSDGWSYSIFDDGTAWIGSYKGTATEVTLPAEINGCPVTRFSSAGILSELSSPDNKVTKLIIPDTDKPIPIKYFDSQLCYSAFYNSPYLKEVVIGSMFSTKLCAYMFSYCKKIEKVTFTEDFTEKANKVSYTDHKNTIKGCIIGDKAFYGCTSLKNFVIPEGVGGIGNGSFGEAPIENISIPSTTHSFAIDGTIETSNLKTVVATSANTDLGWSYDCLKNSDVVIYGWKGTNAEQYALEDGLTFIDASTVNINDIINSWFDVSNEKPNTSDVTNPTPDNSTTDPIKQTDPDTTITDNTDPSNPVVTDPSQSITTTPTTSTVPSTTKNPTVVKKTTVKLAKSSATLYRKGKTTIKVTVKNGKGKTTYKSSNTKIAKVSSKGVVTAVKAGTAKITVTNNGVKKTFKVTVKNPKLSTTKKTLKVKKSFTLKITGKVGKATFTSSDKKVAKVNSKGKITAKKKGTAYITVKTNGIKLKCKVKVK